MFIVATDLKVGPRYQELHYQGPVSPNLKPEFHIFEIRIQNPSHFEI